MNKQQLAAKLWASANDLRGKMDASEYKNYILGLLFYKFLSEHQEKFLHAEQADISKLSADDIAYIKERQGYYIAHDDLYRTWTQQIKAKQWKIAHVTDALVHFRDHLNPNQRDDFEGIFEDVNLTSEKLGSNPEEKENAIRKLIELLNDIPLSDNRQYDTFGFVYEYLIAQFAMSSGKKAGEFYTPHEVSRIMAGIVANELAATEYPTVYDPTVGSGSLLLTLGSAIDADRRNQIRYYGQENNSTTYNIARMNLLMRGVTPANMTLRNGDTLKEDWPHGIIEGRNNPLFVDAVVANPPYSAKWSGGEQQLRDPRFRDYGIAPVTKADYAFLLHSLYHLKPQGIMAIVLPHGVLFRGNEEEKIRTKLLQLGQIDTIIGLPAGIFTNTGIPTIILILRKQPRYNNVLFIDASQGYRKDKNSNVLRERDIKKILDHYTARRETTGYSHLACLAEIEENGYNLNIPRYIAPTGNNESHSVEAHLHGGIPAADIAAHKQFWAAHPQLQSKLLRPIRPGFAELAVPVQELADTIRQDPDYHAQNSALNTEIRHWQNALQDALLPETPLDESRYTSVFTQAEAALFTLFERHPFSDPYEAYQILIDQWRSVIEPDLAILADTAAPAGAGDDPAEQALQKLIDHNRYYKARRLIPNMVSKGREEVQQGVEGELFGKTLMMHTYFADEIQAIDQLKQQIAALEEQQNERIGNAADTALADYLNDKDKLDDKNCKAIAQELKELPHDDENHEILSEALADYTQLKTLKAKLKAAEPALNRKTEERYQTLELAEIKTLLAQKWLQPLTGQLAQITHHYAKNLAEDLQALHQRYADTLDNIRSQRQAAEKAFWEMAAELVSSGQHGEKS